MTILQRERKDGSTAYQVMLRPTGGKTIVKTFSDRGDASMFEEMITQEMKATKLRKALAARTARGTAAMAMETRSDPLLDDPKTAARVHDEELLIVALRAYQGSKEIAAKFISCMPSVLDTVDPKIQLGALKKRWVRQYIDHLRTVPTQFGKPYAWSTIQGYISVINCAVRWRAEERDLPYVPIPFNKRAMFPRNCVQPRSRRLDRGEELELFAALRDIQGPSNRHYRLLARLALETGARLQEMTRAEWSEFDFQRRVWTIPYGHVKTGIGRSMPLTPRALRVMRQLEKMRDQTSPRVFHLLGKPESVSSVFARVVKRTTLVDLRFHDLRHEGISRLVHRQRHLTVDMIMAMVGHSSLAMLRRYTHLRPEELLANMR